MTLPPDESGYAVPPAPDGSRQPYPEAADPPRVPPRGWPEQHPAGDWSAPGWAPPRRNGPGIASVFLGLVALPAVVFVAPGAILGILALALGLIGRGRVQRGEADARGAATAGVVLGSVALALTAIWLVVLYAADRSNQRDYEECLRTGEAPRVCVEQFEPTDP